MLNEAIMQLYCNCKATEKICVDITKPETILEQLTETGVKYTWETVKEEKINSRQSVIEVRVYFPNHVLYGRHIYDTETEVLKAHLHAITNAIKCTVINNNKEEGFINPIDAQNPIIEELKPSYSSNQTQPLSQEEILNIAQQQNNIEQPKQNFKEEIPFDEVNTDLNELDNLLSGPSIQKPNNTQQQVVSHGFTQNQINAINNFKQKLNITNDVVLGNYINAWNNKLSKKEDLTPENIDSFIEWTQTVGKAPC